MTLDTRITLAIAAVVAVVVMAGGWFLGVSPQLAAASAADTATTQMSDQNAVTEAQIRGLTVAKAKLPQMQTTLASLQSSIPDTLQGTAFLDDLNAIAGSAGVTLTSITVGAVVPYVKPSGQAPHVDPLVTGANFGTSQVTVTVTGTPDQEYAFVHGLQYGSRLVLVTSLNTPLTVQDSTNPLTVSGFIYIMNPDIAKLAAKANG
jgi:type II secretory pathway component PulM